MDPNYDAIIIGSGIGGLVTATLLSRKGYRVLVLEAHDRPGGCASSWVRKPRDKNRIARRFIFDSGVQDISGFGPQSALTKLLSASPETKKLKWLRVNHRYLLDGLQFDVPEEWDRLCMQLCEQFPQEASGIEKLFQEISHILNLIECNTSAILTGKTTLASDNPITLQKLQMNYHEFLECFISDKRLINLLTTIAEYVTEDTTRLTVATMIPLFTYYRHGGFYPAGGAHQLAKTLCAEIQSNGGDILFKSRVTSIKTPPHNQKTVTTDTGKTFNAPIIVANTNIAQCLFDLMKTEVRLPSIYRSRLIAQENGPSAILLNIGLDTIPDIPTRTFLKTGKLQLGIGNLSKIDASLAPEGHAAMTALLLISRQEAMQWLSLSAETYRVERHKITEKILDSLTTIIPNIRQHIIHVETATPKTFIRYIHSPHGMIYGPAIGQWSPDTTSPINGLFFVGANTTTGPGVEAAAISGFKAANRIISKN